MEDGGRRAAVPIEAAGERDEIELERLARASFECGEGLQPSARTSDEVLRGAELPRVGALGDLEGRDAVAEEPAQVLLGAPEHRRLNAGRRRYVAGDGAEQLADEPVGRPARERDRAPGAGHAHVAARSWFGANIEPNTDVTASNESFAKGSASASPSTNSTSSHSARARRRASTSSAGT